MKLTILTDYPTQYFCKALDTLPDQIEIELYALFGSSSVRRDDFYANEQTIIALNQVKDGKASLIKRLKILFTFIRRPRTNLCICGWDFFEYWLICFFFKPKNLIMILESSIIESKTKGFVGLLKRMFLSRVDIILVPGTPQKDLATALGFNKTVLITGGVGFHHWVGSNTYKRSIPETIKNLLYVGRLSPEKGAGKIVQVAKLNPMLNFTIIGSGPDEDHVKQLVLDLELNNVKIIGYVENKQLEDYYASNDIFLLPSDSEVWGLVIEEALHFSLPVIVSDKVGCANDLVIKYSSGEVFSSESIVDFDRAIQRLINKEVYITTVKNISSIRLYEDNQFVKAIEDMSNHLK